MSTPSNQSQCFRCLMDNSAPEIVFTDTGCNFCDQAEKSLREVKALPPLVLPTGEIYDCLIGLSGGVDSSYLLHKAVELGLRPLCFSIDTGYNEPEADENIMRLVEGLKVPFYRYTIDLTKFKELQTAFIRSGVKNIEIPTDHVLMSSSFEMAAKYGIKTILSGGNVATESIMPPSWGYSARDLTHIKDIMRKHSVKDIKGLPTCGLLKWNVYRWWYGIKTLYLLDYFDYNRSFAEKLLIEKYGFKSTGGKHEENYFTWWHMNWYLFEKFGIDKRKAHLSSLIMSGQMTRQEALDIVNENPVYPEFGIEAKVLKYPKREHSEFKQDEWLFNLIGKMVKLCGF